VRRAPVSCSAPHRAEAAHILVVTTPSALDVATGGHVLPPFAHLIIDEAHTSRRGHFALAFQASEADVSDFLDRVGRRGQ